MTVIVAAEVKEILAISVLTVDLAQAIYMVILIQIITKVTRIQPGSASHVRQTTPQLPAKSVQGHADTNRINN